MNIDTKTRNRKPEWLRTSLRRTAQSQEVKQLLRDLGLNTVCENASCPNLQECFDKKRATFMILGEICTRNCTFCDVSKGVPICVDKNEPARIAEAIRYMKMNHIVITSVTRDDLPDGGSSQFVNVIQSIREADSNLIIEVLIPDFLGDEKALKRIVDAKPHIINHNLETVPYLYPQVRPMAIYERSLTLLRYVKEIDDAILTKSGLMLGLGETKEQVIDVLTDLRNVSCDFITIGQYLRPSGNHHEVIEYIHPDQFAEYAKIAKEMGFRYVASSPLVRSSYNAQEAMGIVSDNLK